MSLRGRGDGGGAVPTCSGGSRPGRAARVPAGCGGDQTLGSGPSTAAGAAGREGVQGAFQWQAPPTLTAPPAHSAGRPGEQREGHGGQVRGGPPEQRGPCWGLTGEAGAWALTQGPTAPFPATRGCSPGAAAGAAGGRSSAAGGVWCPGQHGTAAQSGPEGPGRCRPPAGPARTVSGTGEDRARGQGCLPGTVSPQLCWGGAEKSNRAWSRASRGRRGRHRRGGSQLL